MKCRRGVLIKESVYETFVFFSSINNHGNSRRRKHNDGTVKHYPYNGDELYTEFVLWTFTSGELQRV